jgi:signal transduction histidine kinase
MQRADMAVDPSRVERAVGTVAAVRGPGESLAEIAHDVRNMVAALYLYCDLLDQPGVLGPTFAHYAGELKLVAAASRKLAEKLITPEGYGPEQLAFWRNGDLRSGNRGNDRSKEEWRSVERIGGGRSLEPAKVRPLALPRCCEPLPSQSVTSLAAEVHATRNLVAALAGPSIAVEVDIEGGALPARISAEDLTRVLVNLVKNAVEAMPDGGDLRISLRESADGGGRLTLIVEDSGPGVPPEALELIFAAGYTTRPTPTAGLMRNMGGAAPHRGLGLAITRSIVEAAGGHIFATNHFQGGARIVMELPTGEMTGNRSWEPGTGSRAVS